MLEKNILVLDYISSNRLRVTTEQHTNAFIDNSGNYHYEYLNLFPLMKLPRDVNNYSAIFLNFTLLDRRYNRKIFKKIIQNLTNDLKCFRGPVYAFPQDEFINMDLLNELFNNLKVHRIYSVANETNWPIIYPDFSGNISRVLTGYLSKNATGNNSLDYKKRRTDIFYRTHVGKTWGKFNQQKKHLGIAAKKISEIHNLKSDIKFGLDNFLLGNDWLEKLRDSRITLGIEGGADFLNWDGSLKPEDAIDAARGYGKIEIKALSPRHFESMQCGCVQVLVEGEYNGILQAGRHYVAVKEDLSNLEEAILEALDPSIWTQINQNCYNEILTNTKYYYTYYVANVENDLNKDLRNCTENKSVSSKKFRRYISNNSCYIADCIRDIRNYAKKITH